MNNNKSTELILVAGSALALLAGGLIFMFSDNDKHIETKHKRGGKKSVNIQLDEDDEDDDELSSVESEFDDEDGDDDEEDDNDELEISSLGSIEDFDDDEQVQKKSISTNRPRKSASSKNKKK